MSIGCRENADYTVLSSVKSPKSALSAMLVRRRSHEALTSDVYYVLVVDEGYNLSDLAKTAHSDDPVLVATSAETVRIRWVDDIHIELICDQCGITKIDVMEKKEKLKSIEIAYKGFPQGTADSN